MKISARMLTPTTELKNKKEVQDLLLLQNIFYYTLFDPKTFNI